MRTQASGRAGARTRRRAWATTLDTPLGIFCVAVIQRGVVAAGEAEPVRFEEELALRSYSPVTWCDCDDMSRPEMLRDAVAQLREYFDGGRRRFALPLDVDDFTPFAQAVLHEVAESVPFGTTVSYGEIAERVGAPRAGRAVGTVMARSPFSIIVPCHRVVRASGEIGEFSRTDPLEGRERKRWLLWHEGVDMLSPPPSGARGSGRRGAAGTRHAVRM